MKTLVCLAVASTLYALPAASNAQQSSGTLVDAVRKAVVTNPEVQARWHGYRAATGAHEVAGGGFLPQVDLSGDIGHRWLKNPGYNNEAGNKIDSEKDDWSYSGAALTLRQMIYDGFATSGEYRRKGYDKLVSYYELLDASENAALEVVRAYADVARYRERVEFAQANYAAHKQVYDQINNRTTAGVSRRVDLDQATARLALAESNLLTEVSNLHDVSARYLRLVGDVPPESLPPLATSFNGVTLPENVTAALNAAYVSNPGFKAAIENVRASEANRDVARSNFHPKLDLFASTGVEHNSDNDFSRHGSNIKGNTRDSRVELQLGINLFRGGSDAARVRQAGAQVNQAIDLREKACRDLRQTLSIAYDETQRLVEQLGYLDQHLSSTGKAREAYHRQFDIGQRTLLDLLDTENEYFSARLAYTSAGYDLLVARARTLASVGQLLHALGVTREDIPSEQDAGQRHEGVDPAYICPAEAPAPIQINKAALTDNTLTR
jgi:adhesin transport system outer membrane protein